MYIAGAALGAGLLGYGGTVLLSDKNFSLGFYLISTMAMPTIFGGIIGAIHGDSDEKLISAGFGAGGGLTVGMLFSLLCALPVEESVWTEKKKLIAENKKLFEDCGRMPCMLVEDKDGNQSVVRISERYKGQRVIFDHTTDVPSVIIDVTSGSPAPQP